MRISKKFSSAFSAGLFSCAVLASGLATAAPTPNGVWEREDKSARITVAPCGKNFCGALSYTAHPGKDSHNPDKAKRQDSLIGVEIMRSMAPTDKAMVWKGHIYNAQNGKIYDGYISLISPNKLKLQGCVMGGLICGGETWHRYK